LLCSGDLAVNAVTVVTKERYVSVLVVATMKVFTRRIYMNYDKDPEPVVKYELLIYFIYFFALYGIILFLVIYLGSNDPSNWIPE